jgi:ATP-binding cassette, subfamily B, bacterial PglK
MKSPYVYHLKNNSARLIRNVTGETTLLVHYIMMPILVVIMEIVMIAGIAIFLFYVEPLNTLIVLVLIGGTGAIFLKLIKSRVQAFGSQALDERANMIQRVNEGLGGIKDIMVNNRQPWFIRTLNKAVTSFAKAETYKQIYKQSSKPIIETVAVAGMMLIALLLLWQGRGIESIIPVLSLFGVATFKLMPSLDKVVNNSNVIRYYAYTLNTIHGDLTRVEQGLDIEKYESNNEDKLLLKKEIVLQNIQYSYPESSESVLNNLSLSIPRGSAVGFVGSSGAGKTTIIDLILGLLKIDSGAIKVDGIDIKNNLIGWQKNIGYIPQYIFLADDTIRNNIAFGLDSQSIDENKVQNAVKMAQLEEMITELPKGLDTTVGEDGVRLSGGQRQRIGIARALYDNPEVLIMDEATSALDSRTEKYIIDSIDRLKKGRTIIIVAHRLTTVENCDTLYIIKDGTVNGSGSYEELIKNSNEFKQMVNAK